MDICSWPFVILTPSYLLEYIEPSCVWGTSLDCGELPFQHAVLASAKHAYKEYLAGAVKAKLLGLSGVFTVLACWRVMKHTSWVRLLGLHFHPFAHIFTDSCAVCCQTSSVCHSKWLKIVSQFCLLNIS